MPIRQVVPFVPNASAVFIEVVVRVGGSYVRIMHSSSRPALAPQAVGRLLDSPRLLADHLLRLASPVASTVNLHPIAALAHNVILPLLVIFLFLPPRRLPAMPPVHQPRRAPFSKFVDGSDRVNGRVQRAARVEVFLHRGQEILVGAFVCLFFCDEWVRKRLVRRHALRRINGQAGLDELAGGAGYASPVSQGGERIVCGEDGLHLLEVRVSVEGRVPAKQEIGNDANRPDVDGFPVAGFFEYLRGHVARCAAGGGEDVEGLLVHDSRKAKVGDEQVGIVFGGAEKEVFGLEVAMHDAVVM